MYISKVSGHRQATLAIRQGLRQLDPTVKAPAVNGFGYTYPLLEKIVNKAYLSVIKRTPAVWDYLYDNPDVVRRSKSIQNYLYRTSHAKIGKLLNRHKPDTVVCTQAFPCGMVADYKKTHHLDLRLIGVLTDFTPHAYWINAGVDVYVVPSEEIKGQLVARGVAPESVRVYGIPLRARFALVVDRLAVAAKLGLDPDVPTVLVMGGGQGLGPIKKIVKSLITIDHHFQMVVLAGVNKRIVHKLREYARKASHKVLIFEFVDNVEELMELASLVITKPGGMTTAESLAKGLPMVIVNPIPGQEERNANFLTSHGIGIRVNDIKDIGPQVETLLKSPERLVTMRKAAYAYAKPQASLDIARMILGLSQKSSPVRELTA